MIDFFFWLIVTGRLLIVDCCWFSVMFVILNEARRNEESILKRVLRFQNKKSVLLLQESVQLVFK